MFLKILVEVRYKMCKLFLIIAVLCVSLDICTASSVSQPLRPDGDISKVIPDYFDSKVGPRVYFNSTPDHTVNPVSHIDSDSICDLNFHVSWSTNLASPIYSSPLIFPTGPEGQKELFLNTFYNNVEILGGYGGKCLTLTTYPH